MLSPNASIYKNSAIIIIRGEPVKIEKEDE